MIQSSNAFTAAKSARFARIQAKYYHAMIRKWRKLEQENPDLGIAAWNIVFYRKMARRWESIARSQEKIVRAFAALAMN